MVPAATTIKAEVEYLVMLAVLNFHRDYLELHYSHVRIQMIDNVIEVTLAPRRPIPAEQLLAQSPEGRAQLQQMHTAAFRSGEAQLRDRLQSILGIEVDEFFTQLDAESGINTVIIRLAKRLDLVLPPVSSNEFEVKHLA
ncbi:MAG: Na-translocating system protein MpsC family protein [Nitrospira sp.]